MDGFSVILSKTYTNYCGNGLGQQIGYGGLTDSLVTEIDLFWDPLLGDKSWNSASFHRCTGTTKCTGQEDANTTQFNLPSSAVSFIN